MSKIFIFPLISIFLLLNISCGGNGYTLNGSVSHSFFNGDSVHIVSMSADSLVVVSSGFVERGVFSLSGSADSAVIASLYISGRPVAPFVIEPGEISLLVGENDVVVSGTSLNDALNSYMEKKDSFNYAISDILRKEARLLMDGASADNARLVVEKEFALAVVAVESYVDSFVRAHYNDIIGPFAFSLYCNGMSYALLQPRMKELINEAPERFRRSRFVESLGLLESH